MEMINSQGLIWGSRFYALCKLCCCAYDIIMKAGRINSW